MYSKNSPCSFVEESSGACHVHAQSWLAVCWTNAGIRDNKFEAEAEKCNSLATLCDTKRPPEFRTAALDSIAHVKSLWLTLGVKWKENLSSFPSASEQDIFHVGTDTSN